MTSSWVSRRQRVMLMAALGLLSLQATSALGQSGIKISGKGSITDVPGGPSILFSEGTASHLGRYVCYGEIDFVPGTEEGSRDGVGVAAFTAADGDLLVGVVTFHEGADGTSGIHFSWRDSVVFSDGSIARSTGRFVENRPPGLIIKIKVVCFLGYCVWFYD